VAGSSSGGSSGGSTGTQSSASASGGTLPFTGTAIPTASAAVVGAGLVAAGVTATVLSSRSRKLAVAGGPADAVPADAPEAPEAPEA
jgi:hypothetical protein